MLMRQDFDLQTAGAEVPEAKTFTGNRGLEIEEGLIFEIGRPENTGVDLDEPLPFKHRLGSLERKNRLAFGLSGRAWQACGMMAIKAAIAAKGEG
jgi:glycine dehydrogenase subunit 2